MKFCLAIVLLLVSFSADAQFKKFIKKAKEAVEDPDRAVKNIVDERADRKQASLDSLDNSYAISFTDNSGMINIKDDSEVMMKGYSMLVQDEEDKTEEDYLRSRLQWGKRFYEGNKLNLAILQLNLAKLGYEEASRTRDINYYETLSTLGLIYAYMGNFDKAESFTLEALEMREDALGTESPAYLASLNNRAVLYKDQGKFNEAEEELKKVIDLTRDIHGKESVYYAIALNNMAMLYQEVGRYEEAEELMNSAIEISEKQQSKRSRNQERFLTNLAILQQYSGQYDAAENTYLKVKNLQERFFKDKNNPELAHTLTNMASLYMNTEEYDKIEPLLKQAVDIYAKKFGEESFVYASARSYLGNFYRGQGRLDEAENILKESLKIRENTLGKDHPDYNESVEDLAVLYWKKKDYDKAEGYFVESLDRSLEFISKYFPPMSEAEKTRYWDKLKGGFDHFYAFTAEAHNQKPELLIKLFGYRMATKGLLMSSANKLRNEISSSNDEELKKLYRDWVDTKELLANAYGLSKKEQDEQEINIPELEEKANNYEKQLSQKSDIFKEIITPESWQPNTIASLLGEGEAAVEMIKYNMLDGHKMQPSYAALILKKSGKMNLAIIENAEQIDTRYYKYYHNTIKNKLEDTYSYDAYWKALEPHLNGIRLIYFSPDGVYSQINPNTLRWNEGQYLVDKYTIANVTTLRELKPDKDQSSGKDAVLLGFPSYGTSSVTSLPGTLKEIQAIEGLLQNRAYDVTSLKEGQATERNVKKLKSPKVLHIATHGYFIEDDKGADLTGFGLNPGTITDNPMLRAGLILANVGLNLNDQNMQGLSSMDNGLLTAYEAINLNLDKTDLVVLSACETGLGEVKAGEGVYGLQRAFVVAGAEAMIMSLWKVDDEATQMLMRNFYDQWMNGKSKMEAFKLAQQKLRKSYDHPYYWGAFVMITGS